MTLFIYNAITVLNVRQTNVIVFVISKTSEQPFKWVKKYIIYVLCEC